MLQEMLWVVALLACWLLLCLNHSEIIALSGALLLGAFPDGYPRELCNNVYRQLLNCLLCLDIMMQHSRSNIAGLLLCQIIILQLSSAIAGFCFV